MDHKNTESKKTVSGEFQKCLDQLINALRQSDGAKFSVQDGASMKYGNLNITLDYYANSYKDLPAERLTLVVRKMETDDQMDEDSDFDDADEERDVIASINLGAVDHTDMNNTIIARFMDLPEVDDLLNNLASMV